ncbi:MAG: hypothetical protein U9R29_04095 [Thermodesulfobacteriota bacterium]|nr:hypothetical protein [Thermodesulfobacteriota bacterium]
MAFFFPECARKPFYRTFYDSLSAVERGIILREFVGVTYRRRYQFFKRNKYSHPQSAFKHNLYQSAQRQNRRFCIRRRIWRKKELLPAYLELIFRHYVLGFVVQILRKRHGDELLAESGCYPDAPLILAALEWFAEHESELDGLIAEQIEQLLLEDSRHLYLYCLRAFYIVRGLTGEPRLQTAIARSLRYRVGGSVALGAELEFSNLGYRASFEHSFGRHGQDQPFNNFIYFHHFFLEDVTWRLGGYLDHHVRLRRFMPVPWIGGFFEYNLVRLDYPRRYSLPLTRDPGFLARYIQQVIAFNHRVAPHSLHLNVECVGGADAEMLQVPQLSDYLCMLLLGGDLMMGDDGRIVESRFARNELIKMVQQRRHESLFDQIHRLVTEFAFLRLSSKRGYDDWLSLILALAGFNRVSDFEHYCLEPLGDLLHWAHQPQPLNDGDIEGFMLKVEQGMSADSSLDKVLMQCHLQRVRRWLNQQNDRLRSH